MNFVTGYSMKGLTIVYYLSENGNPVLPIKDDGRAVAGADFNMFTSLRAEGSCTSVPLSAVVFVVPSFKSQSAEL